MQPDGSGKCLDGNAAWRPMFRSPCAFAHPDQQHFDAVTLDQAARDAPTRVVCRRIGYRPAKINVSEEVSHAYKSLSILNVEFLYFRDGQNA